MNWFTDDSFYELTKDILIPLILSTVATLIHLIRAGWMGIASTLGSWCLACFVGVLAHWTAVHYGISGTLNAVIISMCALLSHMIMDLLFHPRIREAILRRALLEIGGRQMKGAGGRTWDQGGSEPHAMPKAE